MIPRRTHPSAGYSPSTSHAVPHPSTSTAFSPRPHTIPSGGRASVGSDGNPRSSSRRRRNKKPPVSYPDELRKLIHQPSTLIWGRRIPGIGSFDPSQGIDREPCYSVIHIGTTESRCVSQTEAFSGRDDDAEEWGSHLTMILTSRSRSTPPSAPVLHPAATWNRPSPDPFPFVHNGTPSLEWLSNSRLEVPQTSFLFHRSPSLPSDPGSVDSGLSSGDYYDSNTEPPPSRASTSSEAGYEIVPYTTTPPVAVPQPGISTRFGAVISFPPFVDMANVPYPMAPAGVFVPPQTQDMPGDFAYRADDQIFAEFQYDTTSNIFASAGGPSGASYFHNSGTGGAYFPGGFGSR